VRSDVKALLRLFAASFLVVVLLMGVLVASALGAVPREAAVAVVLIGVVGSGIAIGVASYRGLMTRDRPRDPDA
jgi:hypothetical protein